MNRPYSLDHARLAYGAFYETIGLLTFYEIINFGGLRDSLQLLASFLHKNSYAQVR
jgi:hypothetical protein